MITLPPYIYDREVYPQVPEEDRWILNKLMLSERLGHNCGPVGMSVPAGKYCLRPQNSIRGLGHGGFFEIDVDNVSTFMPIVPGYFWCEWFDGDHFFTQYINDVPVNTSHGVVTNNIMSTLPGRSTRWGNIDDATPLPAALQGVSRYMQVEALGDKIIEVAFRMMATNARPQVIADYKSIDPHYDPTDITMGNSDVDRIPYQLDVDGETITGWTWNNPDLNRRPFDP